MRYNSVFLALVLGASTSVPLLAQQASITLKNADVAYCYKQDVGWTLTKTPSNPTAQSGTDVTWTIEATKGAPGAKELCVIGIVEVTNTGSADATIGNIVVNIQRSQGTPQRWTVISADVATAYSGDDATSAKVVDDALQNQTVYPPAIVTRSGNTATFKENDISGSLELTDFNNNTVWAITPQQKIPPGQSVKLLFTATFNADNISPALAANEQMRTEVLVTFGNAGARGGSGSSASNIDINGNGLIDWDEANVRTVPTRITKLVPPLEKCNDSVTLDDSLTATGDATYSTLSWWNDNQSVLSPPTVLSASTTLLAKTTISGTSGSVINTAKLKGASSSVQLVVGTTVVNGVIVPQYQSFPCCEGVDLSASAVVYVGSTQPQPLFKDGDYCTYSQGGFGGNGDPYGLLSNNFATLYPSGVEVGIQGSSGYSMKFTSAPAVNEYLPANGKADRLTADLTNPTSSSSGVFGGQTLTLQINVDLSAKNVTPTGFGSLYYCKAGDSLSGKTIAEILATANTALGGGSLPSGYTYSTLNDLVDKLNTKAFHECKVGEFALLYLRLGGCN